MLAGLGFPALLALGVLLTGISAGPTVGFANLPRLISAHPLYGVLKGYDREIAALRSTQTVAGLDDPAGRTQRVVSAMRAGAQAAQSRAQALAARDSSPDRVQENAALSEILALRGASDREASAYGEELGREVTANLIAYRRAIAQRTERALGARRQQLREKELWLAYTLARRDAPKRLTLRLKLSELHLEPAARSALKSELSALLRTESGAIASARSADEAVLAEYSNEMGRAAATATAQMDAALRAKGTANFAIRQNVVRAESNAAAAVPDVSARLDLFRSAYRSAADAQAIADGFGVAGGDLSRRFVRLTDADRQSRSETAVQIRRLESDRTALYRSIVAAIGRAANRLARDRHLTSVTVAGSQPKGSLDLTPALQAELARLN